MLILGLDPSFSSFGYCLVEYKDKFNILDSGVFKGEAPKDKYKVGAEYEKLISLVINYIRGLKIDKVLIELPALAIIGQRKFQLWILFGLICYNLYKNKVDYDVINSSTAKKVITGNGRADKSLVKNYLEEFTNYKFETLDESDACALVYTYLTLNKLWKQ